MKKLLLKPYVSAIIILLVSTVLSGQILGIKAPFLMILAATAVIISINISSILFYLSLNIESKVGKVLFSIVNLLVFLFIGVFALETLGHAMIK